MKILFNTAHSNISDGVGKRRFLNLLLERCSTDLRACHEMYFQGMKILFETAHSNISDGIVF